MNSKLLFLLLLASNQLFGATSSDVTKCGKNEYPTGCAKPFPLCVLSPKRSAQESCRNIARKEICPDFTWEKCCHVTCQHTTGMNNLELWQKCLSSCNAAIESRVFGIRPLTK